MLAGVGPLDYYVRINTVDIVVNIMPLRLTRLCGYYGDRNVTGTYFYLWILWGYLWILKPKLTLTRCHLQRSVLFPSRPIPAYI